MHAACGFPVTVVQGIEVDIYDRSLLSVLLVIYPADDWAEIVEGHLVDEAVLTMEADGIGIMLMEEVEGMHYRVLVSEETIYPCLFLWSDILKASFGNVTVFLDESLGHHQFVDTILSWILKFLFTGHTAHGIAHFESWVYEDAVGTFQHFCVHTAHGGTDNQVGFLSLLQLEEHFHTFFRMYGYVFSHEGSIGHEILKHLYSSALSGREETVNIHDFLARHEVGELLDIWIFHRL